MQEHPYLSRDSERRHHLGLMQKLVQGLPAAIRPQELTELQESAFQLQLQWYTKFSVHHSLLKFKSEEHTIALAEGWRLNVASTGKGDGLSLVHVDREIGDGVKECAQALCLGLDQIGELGAALLRRRTGGVA